MTGQKILILGGTREAAELAADLVAQGHDVTTSLAGRTKEPKPLKGTVRIGGFGGTQGLADYLESEGFNRLVDATHPFANQISANAKEAAGITGVAFESRIRPPWKKQPGDQWTEVGSLEEARDYLPAGARVFLALGRQHIFIFSTRTDVHFTVRMIDPPTEPLALESHQLVLGRPGEVEAERTLLQQHVITHLVCRNSGGDNAYAKIKAARELGMEVVMVER